MQQDSLRFCLYFGDRNTALVFHAIDHGSVVVRPAGILFGDIYVNTLAH